MLWTSCHPLTIPRMLGFNIEWLQLTFFETNWTRPWVYISFKITRRVTYTVRIIIFTRLLSKTSELHLYFEQRFPLSPMMHAIRIFIAWIRLKERNFNLYEKLIPHKILCWPIYSVSNWVSRVLMLDLNVSKLDSSPVPQSYQELRIEGTSTYYWGILYKQNIGNKLFENWL